MDLLMDLAAGQGTELAVGRWGVSQQRLVCSGV